MALEWCSVLCAPLLAGPGCRARCAVTRDLTIGIGALFICRCVFEGLGDEAVAPVDMAKRARARVGRYIVLL
jgi:hypothetical protein